MKNTLLIIEVISGILLIGAILLHSPKGEGIGGIGGQARMLNSQTQYRIPQSAALFIS